MKIAKKYKGFTLVELLVVIAIIATLASVSAPIMISMLNRSKVVEQSTMMRDYKNAADTYYDDHSLIYRGGTGTKTNGDWIFWTSNVLDSEMDSSNANTSLCENGSYWYHCALLGERLDQASTVTETGKVYLELPESANFKYGKYYNSNNGVLRSIVGAWGRGILIYVDFDRDGEITIDSTHGDFSDNVIRNVGLMTLISSGPDGVLGGGDDILLQ